jgi:hypothetical protein
VCKQRKTAAILERLEKKIESYKVFYDRHRGSITGETAGAMWRELMQIKTGRMVTEEEPVND